MYMKKNIAYLLFLVSFSCTASSSEQTFSLQSKDPAGLKRRKTTVGREDKENAEVGKNIELKANGGSPSKGKRENEGVKAFLAKKRSEEREKIIPFVIATVGMGLP